MGAKPHDSSPFQQEHLAYAEVAINALSDQIRSCIEMLFVAADVRRL